MDYIPTVEDLPEIGQGYTPTIDDLNELMNQPAKSTLPNIRSFIPESVSKVLPKAQIPLGMNIFTGLLSSLMPKNQRQIINELPQAATNTQYGIPQMAASGLGATIPSLMTGGESLLSNALSGGVLGAAQAPQGERTISGIENALATVGIGKAFPYLASAFRKVNPFETGKMIQSSHDALESRAQNGFQHVSKEVNDRGINQIPVNHLNLTDLQDYFPKTKQARQLINDAQNGDYNALRKVQSELWERGTKNKSSEFDTDRMKADEMFEKRDEINDAIANHLINTGNEDLYNILNAARKDYYDLQNVYHSHPTISKMVGESRKIPKNIMSTLEESSTEMNRLRGFNPDAGWQSQLPYHDINADILSLRDKQNLVNWLKTLGIGGAVAGAGYGLLKPKTLPPINAIVQNQ